MRTLRFPPPLPFGRRFYDLCIPAASDSAKAKLFYALNAAASMAVSKTIILPIHLIFVSVLPYTHVIGSVLYNAAAE
jgi:hypothetical protein